MRADTTTAGSVEAKAMMKSTPMSTMEMMMMMMSGNAVKSSDVMDKMENVSGSVPSSGTMTTPASSSSSPPSSSSSSSSSSESPKTRNKRDLNSLGQNKIRIKVYGVMAMKDDEYDEHDDNDDSDRKNRNVGGVEKSIRQTNFSSSDHDRLADDMEKITSNLIQVSCS